jgi:hypothetical protein
VVYVETQKALSVAATRDRGAGAQKARGEDDRKIILTTVKSLNYNYKSRIFGVVRIAF